MRALGILLVIVGLAMLAFTGFKFSTKEKVLEVGSLQVNKEEEHSVVWPMWAGGIAAAAGVVILLTNTRKK